MSKKMRYKMIIDILMTVSLLLLMSYGLFGETYHEWTGVGMFLLFVLHHVLNRKWTGNLRKGKYTSFRILQTVIVIVVLFTMLGSMISGILLSRYVFTFIDVRGVAMLARNVHMDCTYCGNYHSYLWYLCLYQASYWNIYVFTGTFCILRL